MNDVISLLDNYKNSIQDVRKSRGLPPTDYISDIYNLTMSMKHRIRLIQHIYNSINLFDWKSLSSYNSFKNDKDEVIQELDQMKIIFHNEKTMSNYVTLSFISYITLTSSLIDSLAELFNYSFYLGIKEPPYLIRKILSKIPIDSLNTKLREEIAENKDYQELSEIRRHLLHSNHARVLSYSDQQTDAGPCMEYAGVWCIKKELIKDVDPGQRAIPLYCEFIYKKISQNLKDILTISLTA